MARLGLSEIRKVGFLMVNRFCSLDKEDIDIPLHVEMVSTNVGESVYGEGLASVPFGGMKVENEDSFNYDKVEKVLALRDNDLNLNRGLRKSRRRRKTMIGII